MPVPVRGYDAPVLLRRGCGMLSAQLPLPGSTERKGFSAMSGVRSTTTYLRGAEGVHEVGRNARAHARARGDAVEDDVGPSQLGGRVSFTPPCSFYTENH